jgi:hypothetical protein
MDVAVSNLFVPENKCPLDFLADQGDRISNTWILANDEVIEKLKETDGVSKRSEGFCAYVLTWEATEGTPYTRLKYEDFHSTGWNTIVSIEASDIAYTTVDSVKKPNEIIFLQLAK